MKNILLSIACSMLCIISTGQTRYAVVELSSIYMRNAPDYESGLETQELMGSIVEITAQDRYWREIICQQPYRAWCTSMGIVEMSAKELKEYEEAPKYMFTGLYGHVHEEPSEDSATICDLVGGDIMRLGPPETQEELRTKIIDRLSLAQKKWTCVMLPSGKTGWVKSEYLKPHKGFRSITMGDGNADSISDSLMEEIIATAFKLKGVPYLWGGMTPKGVDCSGLVRWSYLMNGVLLPRNASQMVQCGEEVSRDSLQRGDLVFFGSPAKDGGKPRITHVGIYIGNNQIIHSSHLVRVNSLDPKDADYYTNSHNLVAARRL